MTNSNVETITDAHDALAKVSRGSYSKLSLGVSGYFKSQLLLNISRKQAVMLINQPEFGKDLFLLVQEDGGLTFWNKTYYNQIYASVKE